MNQPDKDHQEMQNRLLGGYTEEALRAAFETVQHPENWKLGNEATIKLTHLAITSYAVTFYTGSQLHVKSADQLTNSARVWFTGYYAAVGA